MLFRIVLAICLICCLSGTACYSESVSDKPALSVKLLKKVDVGSGARPEVVATENRVFVVYLDTSTKRQAAYSVKIYNKDLSEEIAYKTLVTSSSDYGRPTDIRVDSDSKHLYAFYELTDNKVSYLFGAKYTLDDKFERVAYTLKPIAKGPAFNKESIGDEIVNDPIVLLDPDSVFAITRIKQKSFSKEEPMIYRIREIDKNMQNMKPHFDVDLSGVAGGEGRQASAKYYKGFYYLVVPSSTKGGDYVESMGTPSDLVLVKFNKNWEIIQSKNISNSPDDIETFILGFEMHNDLLYITYRQRSAGKDSSFTCPLKIYDRNFNLISSTIVKKAASRRESLRSSLEVTDDRIYVGISAGEGPAPPRSNQRMQPGGDNSLGSPQPRRVPGFKQGGKREGFPPFGSPKDKNMLQKDTNMLQNAGNQRAEIYIYEY